MALDQLEEAQRQNVLDRVKVSVEDLQRQIEDFIAKQKIICENYKSQKLATPTTKPFSFPPTPLPPNYFPSSVPSTASSTPKTSNINYTISPSSAHSTETPQIPSPKFQHPTTNYPNIVAVGVAPNPDRKILDVATEVVEPNYNETLTIELGLENIDTKESWFSRMGTVQSPSRAMAWCCRIAWSGGGRVERWLCRIGYGPKLDRIEHVLGRMWMDRAREDSDGQFESWSRRVGNRWCIGSEKTWARSRQIAWGSGGGLGEYRPPDCYRRRRSRVLRGGGLGRRRCGGDGALAWSRRIAWSSDGLKLHGGRNARWPRRISCSPTLGRTKHGQGRLWLDWDHKDGGGQCESWSRRIADCGRWISSDFHFLWYVVLVSYEEDDDFRKVAIWVDCLVDNLLGYNTWVGQLLYLGKTLIWAPLYFGKFWPKTIWFGLVAWWTDFEKDLWMWVTKGAIFCYGPFILIIAWLICAPLIGQLDLLVRFWVMTISTIESWGQDSLKRGVMSRTQISRTQHGGIVSSRY